VDGTENVIDAPMAPGGVPVLGHLPKLAARRVEFLQDLRGFGHDVVRIQLASKPVYVLNSPDAIYEVLVAQSRRFSKGLLFDRTRPLLGNGIVTSDGAFHRRQRRALRPAFHSERIAQYSRTLVEVARAHVDGWRPRQVMAMDREMRRLAAAMLVATLFPPGADPTASLTVRDIGDRVSDHIGLLIRGVLRATLLPSPLAAVPTPGRRRFLAAAKALRQLADSAIQQARQDPELLNGMLALMLASPEAMSDQEASDELLTMLLAGVETTSTCLAWALYALGQNPEIAELVSSEARAADPAVIDPAAMPCTERFLHEVLRLYQPNWIFMRRASEPVRICSVDLPSGAEIIYSAATLHRDPAYFPDPLRFDPDRWLACQEKDLPRCTYLPFGAGNRKCIADSFAWAEMRVATATITALWRLHPAPGHIVSAVADAQIHPDALPMFVTPQNSP
jgi:cytochrome P450